MNKKDSWQWVIIMTRVVLNPKSIPSNHKSAKAPDIAQIVSRILVEIPAETRQEAETIALQQLPGWRVYMSVKET